MSKLGKIRHDSERDDPTNRARRDPGLDVVLSLSLDSRLESGLVAARAVGRLCGEAGFDAAATYAVELCTAEAVVNAVRHAYGERAGSPVGIAVALSDDSIVISVSDQGAGLPSGILAPPELAPDPAIFETHEGGGWGLLLMQRLMDRVELVPSERGTRLRLVKDRPTRPGACPGTATASSRAAVSGEDANQPERKDKP